MFGFIPEISLKLHTIASKGFVTQITNDDGENFLIAFPISFMIEKFVSIKSSRLIPGFLAIPAVIMITALSLIAEMSVVPSMFMFRFSIGRLWERSRHFPFASPSTTSTIVIGPICLRLKL